MLLFSVDGLTEAKVNKYGQDFVNIIWSTTTGSTQTIAEKRSIQDILEQYPLQDAKPVGASAENTYTLFKSGKTVHEIATQR